MKKNRGFSLIELLILLGFIGTILVITLGFTTKSGRRWGIRNVTKEITTKLYQVKNRAIMENRTIQVEFTSSKNYTFRVFDGLTWTVIDDPNLRGADTGSYVTIETPLPNFDFNSRGMVVSHGTSVLQEQTVKLRSLGNKGTDKVDIKIYPYGGIKIEEEFN